MTKDNLVLPDREPDFITSKDSHIWVKEMVIWHCWTGGSYQVAKLKRKSLLDEGGSTDVEWSYYAQNWGKVSIVSIAKQLEDHWITLQLEQALEL